MAFPFLRQKLLEVSFQTKFRSFASKTPDICEFSLNYFCTDAVQQQIHNIEFIPGRDRELSFPAHYSFAERRLIKHTMRTQPVNSLDDCEYLCYLDDNCVSLNIKDKDPESGTHECELNNSTHLEHDADLVNDPVFYYRGAKVMRKSKISTVLLHLPK